jgi:nucleotide-binding universal stress UspA family protein
MTELKGMAQQIGGEVLPVVRRLGQRWNVVDEMGVALICMATHGESAFRHFVVGSTALDVLSKSPCPVLLVRSAPAKKSKERGA